MPTPLPTCKLCKTNPANQTGSHIFSFFLIRGAINKEGETNRDKEILFQISPTHFIDTYFGRSISPEDIEKIKGRELTDEEIENNINPTTIDNLVCRGCELRFGSVETYFNTHVYTPLKEGKAVSKENDKAGTVLTTFDEAHKDMIRLFTYVQIWRASAANYNDWSLPQAEEEKLRKIINELLSDKEAETLRNVNNTVADLTSVPLIISFMETKEELTTNNITISLANKPYFFIVNDMCFHYYTKESHTRSGDIWFYGMTSQIEKTAHINYKENEFTIGYLLDEQRAIIKNNILKKNVQRMRTNIKRLFRELYKRCFNKKAQNHLTDSVLYELVNSDLPLGEKLTLEHVRMVFIENILREQARLNKQ